MKRILLAVILASVYQSNLYSQETRLVTKHHSDFNEDYYVLVEDKNIKHGPYLKFRNDFGRISILETGTYDHGEKHGAWEYYFNDQSFFNKRYFGQRLEEKGIYVHGKKNGVWISYHRDTVRSVTASERVGKVKRRDSLVISIVHNDVKPKTIGQYLNDKRIGEWTTLDASGNVIQKYNFSRKQLLVDTSFPDTTSIDLAHGPAYFGGFQEMGRELLRWVPLGAIVNGMKTDSTTVIVEINISSTGEVSSTRISGRNLSSAATKKLEEIAFVLPNPWIPATRRGIAVPGSLRFHLEVVAREKKTKIEAKFRLEAWE